MTPFVICLSPVMFEAMMQERRGRGETLYALEEFCDLGVENRCLDSLGKVMAVKIPEEMTESCRKWEVMSQETFILLLSSKRSDHGVAVG